MLEKLKLGLKSRTVWTIVALFIINGITGVRDHLPGNWLPVVDGILSLAAMYFRINPRV